MSEEQRKEEMIEALLKGLVPLYGHMDLKVLNVGDGVYRVRVPLRDDMGSHVGTMHPAYQWAAAELLGGLVALDVFGNVDDIFLVVRRVDIEFLKGAKTDIVAEAEFSSEAVAAAKAALDEKGEANIELPGVVKDADGREVARMTGYYMARPRR
jgi:acyl-coenzyme A thioesterase PaaI-like protein